MRVIKFRAWDKEGNNYSNWKPQMIYPENWEESVETKGSILNPCVNSKRFDFMQYTGLKDKNGVDYYEDDLVQCGDFIGQIYYEPKGCKYMWKHIKSDTYFDATFHDAGYRSEIIGNFHQDKHLLK